MNTTHGLKGDHGYDVCQIKKRSEQKQTSPSSRACPALFRRSQDVPFSIFKETINTEC